jgi:predicted permease
VRSAAVASFIPLSLNYNSRYVFVEGRPPARGADVPTAMNASVSADYFDAMGVPLVRGRAFGAQDAEQAPGVLIVNETFARKFFPAADPPTEALGKRIAGGPEGPWREIVGVARDGKYFGISEEPRAFMWMPLEQDYQSSAVMVVRTQGDPRTLIGPVRVEVQRLDPGLPVFDAKTMEEHMGISLFPARVAAALLGAFGLLALMLAAVGLYGVMSFAVAQRTHEIGVRMALGARPRDVLVMVIRQGMTLAALGVALGLLGAYLSARALDAVLYGVGPTDPVTFGAVTLALGAVALLACLVPARRATKVDPMEALRYE